ncbi:MAG: DUF2058 family protein [Planctomycetes bacterium]|nr:DUF2058 family protein [Planctomycetota bacterium]
MSNLRDQLQKANLLSKKDARRLAHEERVHRKETGREGLEAERRERELELEQKRQQEREQDRDRQARLEAERKQEQERAACLAILANETTKPARGSTTWHFELPDGRLPALKLSEADRHQLQGGHLCIVRDRDVDALVFALLPAHLARRVHRTFPECVAWAAGGVLEQSA